MAHSAVTDLLSSPSSLFQQLPPPAKRPPSPQPQPQNPLRTQGDVPHLCPVVVLGLHVGQDDADQARQADGHHVTGKHGVVRTQGVDGDLAIQTLSSQHPGDEGTGQATDSTGHGSKATALGPGDGEGNGHHSRADDHTHGKVHPAQAQADLQQGNGQHARQDAVANNNTAGNKDHLATVGLGVDVGAVVEGGGMREGLRIGRGGHIDGWGEHASTSC